MNFHNELDLPDADCWLEPTGMLRAGDLCQAVPLPRLAAGVALAVDDNSPRTYWVEAEMSWALVLWRYDIYAALAPIAVPETAANLATFNELVEAGRSNYAFVRLPDERGLWNGDSMALLYSPHTRLASELEPLRIASMSDGARERLSHRVAPLFEE